MNMADLLFYVLDVVIFVMVVRWLINSRKIVIRSKVGARWLVPVLFLAVLVLGLFRYEGLFTIIQSIFLAVFAVMFWFIGSGLSEEGLIMQGSLTKWEDAGTVTVKKNDACVLFRMKGKDAALYFEMDQIPDVRKFIADKAYRNHHQ
jgi:hypothetical protein